MNCKDIRIGNYINHRDVGTIQVKSGNDISEIEDWLAYTEYYTGIPINEEWLSSFGFKYDKIDNQEFYTLHYFDCKFLYTNSIMKLGIQGVSQYHWLPAIIDYVHQLQNLFFSLTGLEIEIKANNAN